ncbi:MAG: hypothetical protein LBR22_04450 [Desulfovibrio sp.]|nr:hypothetical protein [Desulfovibrio sp.]
MLAEEPRETGDAVYDVVIGAMAEHFSWEYDLTAPPWSEGPSRFLDEPYHFAMDGPPKYRDAIRRETPAAYARRNLFSGAEPFSRPGKYTSMELDGKPELFFARIRTKEPRVLVPAGWRSVVKPFADEVQPLVDGEFAYAAGRIPERGTLPECYYLSMAINELKLRGGESGWKKAMELVDRMEKEFYDGVIACLRSPLSDGSTEIRTTNAIVTDGWTRLGEATDGLQRLLESDFPDIAELCPKRPEFCLSDGHYFTIAIDLLKKSYGDRGYALAMDFVDMLESGGLSQKTP